MKLNNFFLVFAIIPLLLLASCPIADPPDLDPITTLAIGGVNIPVAGGTPVTTITPTPQFTGTVTWQPNHPTFQTETVYTATITLMPEPGYTLDGIRADRFTVAGATVTHDANSPVITAVFPATARTIYIRDIPGLPAPAGGEIPVTTIDAAQFTGIVAWDPVIPAVPGTFAGATVYTAAITLTARAGYTFYGVPANSLTVAGADTVTNAVNSGVVTAVFPSTTVAPVFFQVITGVTPPAMGETPVTSVTPVAQPQFTGTVLWSPSSGTFTAGTVYTATITLTAEPGFSFDGVAENFFTVPGATATNSANSGVVTAVFPATETIAPTQVNISAIPGVTAPVRGGTPVTEIDTPQYTGFVSWYPAVPDKFEPATQYTATIWLTARPGYTFTGVAANFFTVAGAAPVTNAANSGVVTAVFPETAPLPSGTRTGIAPGFAILHGYYGDPVHGVPVSVTVTMLDGIITNIVMDKGGESLDFFDPLERDVPPMVFLRGGFDLIRYPVDGVEVNTYIYNTQTTIDTSSFNNSCLSFPGNLGFDVGTGASYSFNAIMNAGRDAVRQITGD